MFVHTLPLVFFSFPSLFHPFSFRMTDEAQTCVVCQEKSNIQTNTNFCDVCHDTSISSVLYTFNKNWKLACGNMPQETHASYEMSMTLSLRSYDKIVLWFRDKFVYMFNHWPYENNTNDNDAQTQDIESESDVKLDFSLQSHLVDYLCRRGFLLLQQMHVLGGNIMQKCVFSHIKHSLNLSNSLFCDPTNLKQRLLQSLPEGDSIRDGTTSPLFLNDEHMSSSTPFIETHQDAICSLKMFIPLLQSDLTNIVCEFVAPCSCKCAFSRLRNNDVIIGCDVKTCDGHLSCTCCQIAKGCNTCDLLFCCQICTSQCTLCKEYYCDKNCGNTCMECNACICSKCALFCESCECNFFCEQCMDIKKECSICQDFTCDHCMRDCETCHDKDVVCALCIASCSSCEAKFFCKKCTDDGNMCSVCGRFTCSGCIQTCTNCQDKKVCAQCFDNCEKCSNLVCNKCLSTSKCAVCCDVVCKKDCLQCIECSSAILCSRCWGTCVLCQGDTSLCLSCVDEQTCLKCTEAICRPCRTLCKQTLCDNVQCLQNPCFNPKCRTACENCSEIKKEDAKQPIEPVFKKTKI